MKNCNIEIRNEIKKKGVKYYQVADAIGISPYTLSIWLRKPLDRDKKIKVEKAIRTF